MSGIVSKNAGRASGIVGAGDIGADAIDSEHYADGSIDNAHMADDAIDSEHYAAGSIDEAHIADNAITLDKMAGGTDGNIISFDASGDPVAIATGSDGEVLTSAGAGAPPAFEAAAGGGAWTLITDGTAVASNSASLTITGLDSTYDVYAIAISDLISASDGVALYGRFGDSGGIDSGASDYGYHTSNSDIASTSYAANSSSGAAFMRLSNSTGTGTGEGVGGMYYLTRPGDGTMIPTISGTFSARIETGTVRGGQIFGARLAVITLDRVQCYFSSGNITSGRMSVYGIKHT